MKPAKSTHGGARPNAGRPPVPDDLKIKCRFVYLDAADYAKFVALGASEWLRAVLNKK